MHLGDDVHLTYCTSIHRGEHWPEVERNLKDEVVKVQALMKPSGRFGIGLWCSASAVESLRDEARFAAFKQLLDSRNQYVFTLNGFPYGTFHGEAVKARVYEPDWRSAARLAYTNALGDLLARLLPEGVVGSISTLPGGSKAQIETRDARKEVRDRLLEHVAYLHGIEERTGKRIALALEPEPCCFLETIAEAISFFEHELRGHEAIAYLQGRVGGTRSQAAELLGRHLGLCLDTCHAAVEFENAADVVASLRSAEIPVAKMQLSSGLRIARADAASREALGAFLDPVYLHQVIVRDGSTLRRYLDLPEALATERPDADLEWRVHFHVPVFLPHLRRFDSTQFFLKEILALHAKRAISRHLEVETYTWDVLPSEARELELSAAIAREHSFCLGELGRSA